MDAGESERGSRHSVAVRHPETGHRDNLWKGIEILAVLLTL